MKTKIKEALITIGFIALIIAGFGLIYNGISAGSAGTTFVKTSKREKSNVMVCVKSGHGAIIDNRYQTSGKQSPEWPDGLKIYEGYSCKILAYDLVAALQKNDIDAVLINPESNDTEFATRVERINRMFDIDRRVITISLHHNAQPTDKADYTDSDKQKGYYQSAYGAKGIEIFTTPGTTASDSLAQHIYRGIKIKLPAVNYRTDYSDGDADKEAWFYTLRNTKRESVLIEFCFMTTYSDCLLIANDTVRAAYIKGIVTGVKTYNKTLQK